MTPIRRKFVGGEDCGYFGTDDAGMESCHSFAL